ncbi:ubiquinone menaquinone biosynthesis methyltransferase-like protein [Nannochloropsis gaditana]|nr:ubiquinone menaquinone biosynthesis methyltransferase-like protein [Nannochloropsis gaditana]
MAWIAQDETRFRPRAAQASGEQARRPGKGEIDGLLEGKSEEALWPEPLPPYVKSDFARLDETDDALFYDTPKLVEHIDKAAVRSLSAYYRETFQEVGDRLYGESGRLLDILDVGASWVSHFPPSYTRAQEADGQDPLGMRCRVAGLGMSAEELALNPQLTEFTVQDLNKNPRLPYADGSFDLVVSALTIDYLVRPITLCREMGRVLRPGGRVCVLFSNRLFFTKAVANWAGKDDVDHVLDVATYLHYANGESGSGVGEKMLSKPHAKDISPSPTKGDPLYVVWADRL